MARLNTAANSLKPKKKSARFAQVGDAGYDNPRENIDPHVKTKVLDSSAIYTHSVNSHPEVGLAIIADDDLLFYAIGDDVIFYAKDDIRFFCNGVEFLSCDQGTGVIDANTHKIVGVVDPTNTQDAATKNYVDNNAGGQQAVAITVEAPTASEDITVFYFKNAVTVSQLRAVVIGSSTPSVTIDPRHHTDRSNAGNQLLSAATAVTSTTGTDVSLASGDVTIPSGSFLWLETTAKSGTVTELHLTFVFSED